MGETALHGAVMYRNYAAVEALLDAGADVRIKDFSGKTALEQGESDECIAHLFSGGRISQKPVACAPQKTESGIVRFSPN
jgi:Ankyrin repeats (many copies)